MISGCAGEVLRFCRCGCCAREVDIVAMCVVLLCGAHMTRLQGTFVGRQRVSSCM